MCGGRDFDYETIVWELLTFWHEGPRGRITTIICGGAKGADTHAESWGALYPEVPVEVYPAEWSKHGRSAGPIRNRQMLEEGKPDLVIAFPGDRGTAGMIKLAKAADVEVIDYG